MSESDLLECKICESTGRHSTYKVREMMVGLRDSHHYFECSNCGCLQIVDVPKNIQDYYPSDYYSYNVVEPITGIVNSIKAKLIKSRDRFAATGKGILGGIMQYIQPHDKLTSLQYARVNLDSNILDVGCGAGQLLHSMKQAGFKNILGIDPFNTDNIQYKNGLSIIKNSIHELAKNNNHEHNFDVQEGWDLIMFNHSYEHVFDQVAVLEKTWELLKPGGICMLRLPTVSSWAWRYYIEDWVQLDAPRHFFLHSSKSVQILAEKTGFSLDNIVYDSFAFQSWGSEQYKQDIALHDENSYAVSPEKSPFSTADIRSFTEHSKVLNKSKVGDQAAFYLKKRI